MVAPWEVEEEETLLEFRIGGLLRVKARSPRTGRSHDFYELRFPDWINVIPLDTLGRVLLIKQYRVGVRAVTVEIPGGLVEPGETPEQTARRELGEETGYEAPRWNLLGTMHPNPAIQGNVCHTFLAEDAVRVGEPSLEPAEDIEIVPTSLDRIPDMIRRGEITHTLVISAFQQLWLRLPDIGGRAAGGAGPANGADRGEGEAAG